MKTVKTAGFGKYTKLFLFKKGGQILNFIFENKNPETKSSGV